MGKQSLCSPKYLHTLPTLRANWSLRPEPALLDVLLTQLMNQPNPFHRSCALCLALALSSTSAARAATWNLPSPDGTLSIQIEQPELDEITAPVGSLRYTVRRGGRDVVLPSPLGLNLSGADGDLSTGLRFLGASTRVVRDNYTLISGKARNIRGAANEETLLFTNPMGRQIAVVARAYNDGVAFRYRLPAQSKATVKASVESEGTGFHIARGSKGWVANYVPNYEEFYPEGTVGAQWNSGEQAMPALFDVGSNQFVLLAESDVRDAYCSSHLAGSSEGVFGIRLAEGGAAGTLPWATPWRVIITGSLAQMMQSTLVDTLAAPPIAGDASWVRPGRVTWSWWSQGTGDLALHKHYVDFAQSMGWEYSLVDEGWAKWNNNNPGPAVTELVNYGRERGVGILLWAHYNDLNTPEKRASRLPLWKSWGIAGVKIDFFDSDSQRTMGIREAILRATWDNKLMVNFHGDQSPRGQNRTWPHFLTREGVRGAENFRNSPPQLSAYNATLPFTRNLIGPMDYTPVTFSVRNRTTTAAHELALAVVFQSGWQHLADSPESYNALPVGRDFLKQVPADWDETRFLGGYPAQFTCLARRKGSAWFIGMNNAGTPRSLKVPLGFLSAGQYQLELYHDGDSSNAIVMSKQKVTSRDVISVDVPANGGFAARLVPEGRQQ